ESVPRLDGRAGSQLVHHVVEVAREGVARYGQVRPHEGSTRAREPDAAVGVLERVAGHDDRTMDEVGDEEKDARAVRAGADLGRAARDVFEGVAGDVQRPRP